jgi:hypothetical protein
MATMRNVARAGALFVVLFLAGFVLLGDLIGSFADADRAFVDHFAQDDNRLKDIVGAYLLLLAALCLTWFTVALAARSTDRRVPLIAMGSVAAGAMVMAALAFLTVPLSISFGDLSDDPGVGEGPALLPQLGFTALFTGVLVPAAVFVVLAAREPHLLPRWLAVASYPTGALLLVAVLAFAPIVLLPAWVAAASITLRRRA